jgi:hypothetical protein
MASAPQAVFLGGATGPWAVTSITAVRGEPLAPVAAVERHEGPAPLAVAPPALGGWALRGTISNERYVELDERRRLAARQEGLGRAEATGAALIPITKSAVWWTLAQDERRAILEARSRHIALGLDYLPAVARRLHHGRDLGEPFDFLTWFEFRPADAGAFDELVGRLRETEEWTYVVREVDVRLHRGPQPAAPAGPARPV